MRVFVCSPLRGPHGLPSVRNIELARMLMRAVFDAGHQPYVPHLLYPQVLSESEADLKAAFAANYAFLDVCEEIWVYARELSQCSSGMKAEVEYAHRRNTDYSPPHVVWMPMPFVEVEKRMVEVDSRTERIGECSVCKKTNGLNRQGICLPCFAGGTPA